MNTTEQRTLQSIYPVVRYDDARAAIAWLTSVLGFEEQVVYPGETENQVAHAQLKLGGNLIMLGSVNANDSSMKSPRTLGAASGSVYIGLDTAVDVDSVYARAKTAGANISRELCDTDYGSHEFSVRDPEGHHWSFGTYRPSAD
jgi:uncharacterized glyoxalase superfamily protein PhnB